MLIESLHTDDARNGGGNNMNVDNQIKTSPGKASERISTVSSEDIEMRTRGNKISFNILT